MRRNWTRAAIVFSMLITLSIAMVGAQQGQKKSHTFHGKVEKVDPKAKSLTVAGENVDGWMAAMTMSYKVDKDEVLTKLKPGDQITATVYDGDFAKLYDVQVVPPKK